MINSPPIGMKETFTPQVIFYEVSDLETALEMINRSGYGLALSLFTEDKKVKEEVFYRAKVGLINYNLSSIGGQRLFAFWRLGEIGK